MQMSVNRQPEFSI